ncbi:hypothetical protein CONPUDRAFT_166320 [Coniophora puteana RWD-64-598 SS2]|uniref:F-box domain-containing protein n=1 Tax=Coniophora puteana (strain RWD-64-598) TaxID=741705 RepID=A0A5M3MKG6_CONPW|nr:uncharacterized protein CONPUDRAFT_166320 [Coniophora puteana RWD-64-598 SS2]EIW79573.1 hypothetical protein CONPUDRAFT_166320 [Coniophora puteana RWD-64-598 SS2]
MSLINVPHELLVLIVQHTDIQTILSLQKTCRALYNATQDKQLWLIFLQRLVHSKNAPLHCLLQKFNSLTSQQVQALACRSAYLCDAWAHNSLTARHIIRSDLPRSVTWLKLVEGRWLLVASMDTMCSRLEVYDISATGKGIFGPLAGCYLSGPITSGEADIRNGQLRAAVAVDARVPQLQVMLLHEMEGVHCFAKAITLTGYGEVMLLYEDIVVCGIKDNIATPHVVCLDSNHSHRLETVPDNKGTRKKACIWNGMIVTVGVIDVKLYNLPSSEKPPVLCQTLLLPISMSGELEEVSFSTGHAPSFSAPFSRSSLCTGLSWIRPVVVPEDANETPDLGNIAQLTLSRCQDPEPIAEYELTEPRAFANSFDTTSFTTGGSGYRALYVHMTSESCIQFLSLFPEPVLGPTLECHDALPSLSSFPQIDYDDALGIVVIGNLAGELAIVDLVGTSLESVFEGERVPSTSNDGTSGLVPTSRIPIDVVPSPWNWSVDMCTEVYEELLISDHIASIESSELDSLPENWRDQGPLRCLIHRCEDVPFREDLSFELSHTFEYIGRAHLILYDSMIHRTLLSKGGLYFLHEGGYQADNFFVFPGGTTLNSILACIRESPHTDFSILDLEEVIMRSWTTIDKEDNMSGFAVAERRDHSRNRFEDMRLAEDEEIGEVRNDKEGRWKAQVPALPALRNAIPLQDVSMSEVQGDGSVLARL